MEDAAEAGQAGADAHTKLMTRSTSMPDDSARSRLSATARIALPMRVRCRNRATPTSTTTDEDHDDQVAGHDAHRPELELASWSV